MEGFTQSVRPSRVVFDAAGSVVPAVKRARETEAGIEIEFYALDEEGNELVGSPDGGVTYEPITAKMVIPDGMIAEQEY